MGYDPMEGFQIGQAIGKSKGSALGNTAKYMSDLTAERDKNNTKVNPLELLIAKNALQSPLQKAQTDLASAKAGQVSSGRGVFMVNPNTGEIEQSGTVPYGAKVLKQNTPSGQESMQLSNIDQMLDNISHIRTKLQADPSLPLKAKVPFMAQDYKAYINNLKRQIALETGGKNLTANELAIVHQNIPNEEDIFSPQAMEIKLKNIENTVTGTKNRISGGQFNQSSEEDMVRQALAQAPNKKKAILAAYKQKTGRDYA